MMDVRLHHRGVGAHPTPILDLACARVQDDGLVHGLPGLGPKRADVRLQRRLHRCRRRRRQATESAKLVRVAKMERKLRVAEAEHLLDQRRAKNLLGAHAFASLLRVGLSPSEQVLANPLQDREIGVESLAHHDELLGPRMVALGCQRKLRVVEISHRGFGLVFQGGLAISPRNSRAPALISMNAPPRFPCAFMPMGLPGRELASGSGDDPRRKRPPGSQERQGSRGGGQGGPLGELTGSSSDPWRLWRPDSVPALRSTGRRWFFSFSWFVKQCERGRA